MRIFSNFYLKRVQEAAADAFSEFRKPGNMLQRLADPPRANRHFLPGYLWHIRAAQFRVSCFGFRVNRQRSFRNEEVQRK